MATKNIVPRSAGEGSLGIESKPWGVVYANSIPLCDTKIAAHNANNLSHSTGIAGNAATATKLKTPVTINGVSFDGTRNITIDVQSAGIMTASEAREIFNNA